VIYGLRHEKLDNASEELRLLLVFLFGFILSDYSYIADTIDQTFEDRMVTT
jgi:hypothetical protein